jgi:hypothetical protein
MLLAAVHEMNRFRKFGGRIPATVRFAAISDAAVPYWDRSNDSGVSQILDLCLVQLEKISKNLRIVDTRTFAESADLLPSLA